MTTQEYTPPGYAASVTHDTIIIVHGTDVITATKGTPTFESLKKAVDDEQPWEQVHYISQLEA